MGGASCPEADSPDEREIEITFTGHSLLFISLVEHLT